ncbi:ATP-sensitive inward rectifier potassium channel 11-like isoform X2 [Anthonomus grandis grandis]|uniref:ATP-sensitive inward rectifier potassium channel 11-like isoform X2 n=1 Tax=Anthonomus grandis grandis TaxID=2921223 RepID=UPI002165A151|nr:ATP-sensitive inward rectifier potassium channel 11-like isoform X2 [Anthonomus grandis grandis]
MTGRGLIRSETLVTLNNNDDRSIHADFAYPLYVIKNRPSILSRRSSLQSWQQRQRYKLVRRLVRKNGKSSIHQKSSTERSFRFLLDLSNTLIESSWFLILGVVSFVFVLTWVMFAGFWAIISIENVDAWNGTADTCLEGIHTFSGYLLFSIETQTTIGYGGRYINEYCPEAIIGLCIQLVIGAGVCGSLVCIVFLKMVAPLKNSSMVCFSNKAVICQRDGHLCLIFRIRDYDLRYRCHTKIVAYVAEEKGGELTLKVLKVNPPGILIWPLDVIHKIDESSPFWDLSAKDLIMQRFEIIVVLEGECLSTSFMSRATTSYVNREIKWGYRFVPCTKWNKAASMYVVDHKKFNKTEEVTTPLCSAQRLSEVYDDIVTSFTCTESSYSNSKISSPCTMSPLTSFTGQHSRKRQHFHDEIEEMSTSDDEADKVVVSADIHYKTVKVPRNDRFSDESSSSSGVEADELTFTDVNLEQVEKRRKSEGGQARSRRSSNTEARPRTLSGTAKDLFNKWHRYVKDGSGRNKLGRNYEETDF